MTIQNLTPSDNNLVYGKISAYFIYIRTGSLHSILTICLIYDIMILAQKHFRFILYKRLENNLNF